MTVYLNAASHGLPSPATRARVLAHLRAEDAVGPVAARDAATAELEAVRANAATLIGADARDVAFFPTTCSGWLATVIRLPLRGRRLLVAPHEWSDNVAALRLLAAQGGATVETLPPWRGDAPDLDAWAARIDEDVAAIFLPMVSSVTGRRYPVAAIGALPRPEGCRLVIDGAQALGQTPIDVATLGADVLAATCRKWLRGPRNTAILWTAPAVRDAGQRPPEPTDWGVAQRLGLGVAIAEALETGVETIAARLAVLAEAVRAAGAERGLPTADGADPATGAVTLALPPALAQRLAPRLAGADIVAKFPDAAVDEPCAADAPEGAALLRVSPHLYNDPADIAALFAQIDAAR